MKTVLTAGLLWSAFALVNASFAGEQLQPRDGIRLAQAVCEQVISCGMKDGKWKEYPTPCAARDDGATNVKPKTGPTCESATK